jgi:hypothetical protein
LWTSTPEEEHEDVKIDEVLKVLTENETIAWPERTTS